MRKLSDGRLVRAAVADAMSKKKSKSKRAKEKRQQPASEVEASRSVSADPLSATTITAEINPPEASRPIPATASASQSVPESAPPPKQPKAEAKKDRKKKKVEKKALLHESNRALHLIPENNFVRNAVASATSFISSLGKRRPSEDFETEPAVGSPAYVEKPIVAARPWRRLAAFTYDFLLVCLFNALLFVAAFYTSAKRFVEPITDEKTAFLPVEAKDYFFMATAVGIFVSWLYLTVLEALPPGATIGKKMFSIRTADLNGKRISLARANLRFIAKLPSALFFGIGCIAAVFRRDRRALHDVLAKTLVVRSD